MTVKRNPKLVDTPFLDCIVQKGTCPLNCNQCFYNRPGAYYVPLDELPLIPSLKEVGAEGIVRMNCGHDSNIDFEHVCEVARRFRHVFFNTAIPKLNHFPGPVVFTANPKECERATLFAPPPKNLMFVRLRTSGTNLHLIDDAVEHYTAWQVPVVITMMAYYDRQPIINETEVNRFGAGNLADDDCYEWQVRHVNSYWCPTPELIHAVMARYASNRLVALCSSRQSYYCRNCRNCETYYIQTLKRMRGE